MHSYVLNINHILSCTYRNHPLTESDMICHTAMIGTMSWNAHDENESIGNVWNWKHQEEIPFERKQTISANKGKTFERFWPMIAWKKKNSI